MGNLLFIHGFATGPSVWQLQEKSLSSKAPAVIGWSLGGIEAIKLAADGKINLLVLVSAFPKFLKSDDYPFGIEEVLLDRLEKKLKSDFSAGVKYFYRLIFNGGAPHPAIASLPLPPEKSVFDGLARLRTLDIRGLLPQIDIPVLIIHGAEDRISLPAAAEYMQGKIRRSKLVIMPGAAHAPFLEKPVEFNTLVKEFINQHA